MTAQRVCTTCPYCGVGCGVEVTIDGQKISVAGDQQHPANYGRLCVKGASLAETIEQPNRLLQPHIHGKAASWDNALNYITDELKRIIKVHGSDSVGFYVSGQLLTEDYYVANKLMKGFIGSGNIDTNSRLCMASAVAAHKRAFGEDLVPGCYEDLEQAELVLVVGSNMAYTHPVVFQRIIAARERNPNMHIVVLDPRRSATCEVADDHLPLAPASDVFFFNGLLAYLADNDKLDHTFIEQHTDGFNQTLQAARQQATSLQAVAELCDVDRSALESIYQRFANTEKVVTVFCQGINQSASGTDKANTIINCHLASGKIGKPGAAPFSITGQPNAMGGREVGGLANTLAAHMEYSQTGSVDNVANFWHAPNMATEQGLKAVDMMEAVHSGKIKALWIMATNPVVSMPDADFVKQALNRCELLIVSDCSADSDTARLAQVLLPACTWGEKTGTVTNSERRISLQRTFLPVPGEAKPDWQIMCEVAKRMGFEEDFNYQHPAEIFREHAALSGHQNDGKRFFNIADKQHLSNEEYMALQPFQWPQNQSRLFTDGQFSTASGRANFIPVTSIPAHRYDPSRELLLNTGRIRDQWHTMTRTGSVATLFNHIQEPFIQIHPDDAKRLQLKERSLARIFNNQAEVVTRVRIAAEQRRGEVFIPMHWNNNYSSQARVSTLIKRLVDPISGQPQFKQTAVTVAPFTSIIEGVLLLDGGLSQSWQPTSCYWSKISVSNGSKYFIAETELQQSTLLAASIQQQFEQIKVWLMLSSQGDQGISLAGFIDDRLVLALFTGSNHSTLPDTSALEPWLGKKVPMSQRFPLLAGDEASYMAKGPTICSCHQVGQFEIERAIESGADTVENLGKLLKCGTKCGSCVPELQKLIIATSETRSITTE